MFDRILVALDGSGDSRRAGALAARLAARLGSRLAALSVVDARIVEGPAVETLAPLWGEVTGRPFQPEVLRVYRERAAEILAAFAEEAETAGCALAERYIEIGVAEETILARAADADLVVMGRRGEHAAFGSQPAGSTVWRVLRRTPVPVLLSEAVRGASAAEEEEEEAGEGASGIPKVALVAFDAGEPASRALDLAIGYARAVEGEIRVVHAGAESADPVLEKAHERLRDAGVPWESARLDLDPAEAVSEAIRRWEAECLFMGSLGRGRIRDFLFGSHTAALLEAVRLPAFLVR